MIAASNISLTRMATAYFISSCCHSSSVFSTHKLLSRYLLAATGPAPVSCQSFEGNTRHQGNRIWQRYTSCEFKRDAVRIAQTSGLNLDGHWGLNQWRLNGLVCAFPAIVWPDSAPPSRWTCRIRTRRLSGEQPDLPAIAVSASCFALMFSAVFHRHTNRTRAKVRRIRLRHLLHTCLLHHGQFFKSFAPGEPGVVPFFFLGAPAGHVQRRRYISASFQLSV